ncbi:MAG: M20 family metallo-hydrolase, partial [Alphaproteobacteria bacterium]|nr:M20 family metallo-hydrolase [Alphaproteobacteria bacterium]
NVVPGETRLRAEIRDVDGTRLAALAAEVPRLAAVAAKAVGVAAEVETLHRTAPAPMNEALATMIEDAARQRNLATIRLPSGAGHDAQNFAALVPTAMIFVPSVGGRSHCPEETTDEADLAAGVDVLEAVVRRLLAR